MSAESSVGVGDEQSWFFTLLSESQAETILNEGSNGGQTTRGFLVSNLPSSKDYRISIRRRTRHAGFTINYVEHIIISYNEEDQSYGIEGQKRYQSVVDAVRNYIASHGGETDTSYKKGSNESTRTEEPPAYIQYPTDNQPLPQIKTKLDINKVEEGKPKGSFQTHSSRLCGDDECNCNHCFCGACDMVNDFCDWDDSGWCRRIFLIILFTILFVFCGFCLLTLFITIFLSLKLCSDVGFCDKCGPWCGCEDFCEEHFVCCDED